MKIGIISSCGGHLTEIRYLQSVYTCFEHFYVVNDRIQLPTDMQGKTYFIAHSERDWKLIVNFLEALLILKKEKPFVLLSTGAGPIVPFSIVGKLFFKMKIVYIESIANATRPSLSGRIMYRIADKFYFQWNSLKNYFPKGEFIGPLI
jgi:UDP-N-acetylglucosamine:LPS N-acetylglucosamine transferase